MWSGLSTPRQADEGADVALFVPFDDVVFERTSAKNSIAIVALSQVTADPLTSPGRGPNEAQALIQWVQANDHTWRT